MIAPVKVEETKMDAIKAEPVKPAVVKTEPKKIVFIDKVPAHWCIKSIENGILTARNSNSQEEFVGSPMDFNAAMRG
jgi:hypothetical protein